MLLVITTMRGRGSGGQALVEFALVIPIFLLIVFSIIQFGFLLGGQDALTNSVREATRYVSTIPVANTTDAGSCSSGVGAQAYSKLVSSLQQKVPGYSAGNLVACGAAAPASTVSYCVRANPDSTKSIWVTVKVVYRHPLFVPIVGPLLDGLDGGPTDNALTASASEQMRVETFNLSGSPFGGFLTCS